ncbi:MAG: hypothetical protein JEZ14_11770 [Marinilabiliaceae bacterium]|nr:hypothetical protein [Marinilabiliaceae bacterium]
MRSRKIISVLLAPIGVASLVVACGSAKPIKKEKPNVIFIMSDDHAISETNDVHDQYPDVVKQLKEEFIQ